MKRIIQVATIALVFVLWAPVGYACWCFKPDVREAYDLAKVVFVGEVVEVVSPRSTEPDARFVDGAHTIKFKVETAWKEPFWTEISVLTRMDSCFGLPALPQKGEKYLVYAEPVYPDFSVRTEVMTSSCTRTTLLSGISPDPFHSNQAADDIRQLDNIMLMLTPQRPLFNPLRLNWRPKN
jgi:hypothetical protein